MCTDEVLPANVAENCIPMMPEMPQETRPISLQQAAALTPDANHSFGPLFYRQEEFFARLDGVDAKPFGPPNDATLALTLLLSAFVGLLIAALPGLRGSLRQARRLMGAGLLLVALLGALALVQFTGLGWIAGALLLGLSCLSAVSARDIAAAVHPEIQGK